MNNRISFLVLLTLAPLLAPALGGCDDRRPAGPTNGETAVGQKDNCYVCGEHEIDVLPDTARVEHQGKTFYFCSDDCKETFTKNPAPYVARRDAREAKAKG
jgi:YHS domain-containing protein